MVSKETADTCVTCVQGLTALELANREDVKHLLVPPQLLQDVQEELDQAKANIASMTQTIADMRAECTRHEATHQELVQERAEKENLGVVAQVCSVFIIVQL